MKLEKNVHYIFQQSKTQRIYSPLSITYDKEQHQIFEFQQNQ